MPIDFETTTRTPLRDNSLAYHHDGRFNGREAEGHSLLVGRSFPYRGLGLG